MKASGLLDRLKKGSSWSLLARVSGSLSVLVVCLLARLLPVESLGAYCLFLQLLTFAAWFVKMGMTSSLQMFRKMNLRRQDKGNSAYIAAFVEAIQNSALAPIRGVARVNSRQLAVDADLR